MSRTKTAADIEAIKQTVAAAEAGVLAVLAYLAESPDPTSEEAKEVLDTVLETHGCESPVGRIVAGGLGTYEPHYLGAGVIEPSLPIVIDVYPRSKATGWYADMTRTVCIGEPSEELQAMYNAVKQVQQDTIALLRPGANCDEIQQAAVDQFVSLGYKRTGVGTEFKFEEGFVHSIGHGLDKDVHEEPFFGGERDNVLQVGDVITIEPGLYHKHIGGVRLEDLFVITEDGYEQLTTLPLALKL